MKKTHHHTYNRHGDNVGLYIITSGRCAFRSIHDCKPVLAVSFKNSAEARAHARKAIANGDRFGNPPTMMGSESKPPPPCDSCEGTLDDSEVWNLCGPCDREYAASCR